jgi:hypothetical protein
MWTSESRELRITFGLYRHGVKKNGKLHIRMELGHNLLASVNVNITSRTMRCGGL